MVSFCQHLRADEDARLAFFMMATRFCIADFGFGGVLVNSNYFGFGNSQRLFALNVQCLLPEGSVVYAHSLGSWGYFFARYK